MLCSISTFFLMRSLILLAVTMWLLLRLKRPYDKTPAVWIGSRRHSHVKFLIYVNFCRDPVIFRLLEVFFIIGSPSVGTINYNKPEGRKKQTSNKTKKETKSTKNKSVRSDDSHSSAKLKKVLIISLKCTLQTHVAYCS